MKNFRLLLLTIHLILPLLTIAQSKVHKPDLGIMVGLSLNNVYDHIVDRKFDSRLTPVLFGVFADFPMNERLTVTPELSYVAKGPVRHRINYLVLTGIGKYQILKKNKLYFLLGPYAGYMFKYLSLESQLRIKIDAKKFDFGVNTGVDYTFDLTDQLSMFISPRIELGLFEFSNSKHLCLQLRTGIKF